MSMTGTMRLVINDLTISWNESDKRVLKPCIVCGKRTRGRTWGGGGIKKPACIGCAITSGFGNAKKIYNGAA